MIVTTCTIKIVFLSDHNEERGKVSNDSRGTERPRRGGLWVEEDLGRYILKYKSGSSELDGTLWIICRPGVSRIPPRAYDFEWMVCLHISCGETKATGAYVSKKLNIGQITRKQKRAIKERHNSRPAGFSCATLLPQNIPFRATPCSPIMYVFYSRLIVT